MSYPVTGSLPVASRLSSRERDYAFWIRHLDSIVI
jgi:hypothetical protein